MVIQRDRSRDLERQPTHPGKILTSFMDHEELTQQDLAERMDVPRQRLSGIINKRRRITADTAHRLARVLDTTPEFWMNLQTSWDLWEEQEENGDEFADLNAV